MFVDLYSEFNALPPVYFDRISSVIHHDSAIVLKRILPRANVLRVAADGREKLLQMLAAQDRYWNIDDRADGAYIGIVAFGPLPGDEFGFESCLRFRRGDHDEFLARGIARDFPRERRVLATRQQ